MKKIIEIVLVSALIFSTYNYSYSQGSIIKGEGVIVFKNGTEHFEWSKRYAERANLQEYVTNYAFKYGGNPVFLKLTHDKKNGIIRYAFSREDNTIFCEAEQELADFIISSDNTLKGDDIKIQYVSEKKENIRLISVICVGLWIFEEPKTK